MSSLTITQMKGIPLIQKGENLSEILLQSLKNNNITLKKGDILGITSKIVSKAEGRMISIKNIHPSEQALELSHLIKRDPGLIELILSESKEIIRATEQAFIVEHRLGFICANAGIDQSNVRVESGSVDKWYLLLPENPDRSAKEISKDILKFTGVEPGIIIIDSHGRPWRKGIVGAVIGTHLVPPVVDLRGKQDLFGYRLRITMVAAADELAAGASLMMGQADEKIPAVHIRGFPYQFVISSLRDVLRPKETDLFR